MRGNTQTVKVHFQGHEEDFIVFVSDAQSVRDWRNDRSIPLAQVLNGWQVFITHKHGAQGTLDTASHQILDNEFGSHREEDVITKILEKGVIKESHNAERQGNRNDADGPMVAH